MKQGEAKIARAIIGIIVLMGLAWLVNGYVGEYRESSGGSEPTAADSATASAPPSDEGGVESESEQTPSADPVAGQGFVVVQIDGLNLRKEAKADSPTLGGLEEGDKLTLISQTEGWYEVQTASGSRGWVSANPSYVKIEEQ